VNAILRLVAWLVAVALVALPVVAVLRGWIGAEQWPLRTLRAQGEFDYVDARQVRATLLPYARRGFFAVDLQAAQAAVAALPWVEKAEVRKRWPDVLEVRISEHRPYAHWGADRLLSQRGRVFAARGAKVPAGLPKLGGPEARVREVVELYQQSRELFAPVGLVVEGVELDPRGSWSVRLLNRAHGGAVTQVVVGRSEARARIGRFVRLLPQLLVNPERRIERADLRYTNGFALNWAAPAAKTGSTSPSTALQAPRADAQRAPTTAPASPASPT
jgi:cell division protein FtsQ